MGLSHYPSAAEGLLPILVINTVLSVTILKNMVKTLLQVMGCVQNTPDLAQNGPNLEGGTKERGICVSKFKSMSSSENGGCNKLVECCVCLHGFEDEEEVIELLSCKHFFHKGCLEKWLGHHKQNTCPLCRSRL